MIPPYMCLLTSVFNVFNVSVNVLTETVPVPSRNCFTASMLSDGKEKIIRFSF